MDSLGNAYVNRLVPQDANMLRALYKKCGVLSKDGGWTKIHSSILIPRLLLGPLTIPVALIDSFTYETRGFLRFGIEVLDGRPLKAIAALLNDTLSAVQCLGLTVANVAYAVFGGVIGSKFFIYFIPLPLAPTEIEKLTTELTRLKSIKSNLESKLSKDGDKAQIELLKREISEKENDIVQRELGFHERFEKQELGYREAFEKKNAELAALYESASETQSKFQSIIVNHEKEIFTLESKLAETKNEAKTAKEKLEELTAQLTATNSVLAESQKSLPEAQQAQLKLLKDQLDAQTKKAEVLEMTCRLKEQNHQYIYNELQVKGRALKLAENQLEEWNKKINQYEKTIRLVEDQKAFEINHLQCRFSEESKKMEDSFDKLSQINLQRHSEEMTAICRKYELIKLALETEKCTLMSENKELQNQILKISTSTAGQNSILLKQDNPLRPPSPNDSVQPNDQALPEPGRYTWNLHKVAVDMAYNLTRVASESVKASAHAITSTLDFTRRMVWDSKDPWKAHRYDVGLDQMIKVFDEKEILALSEIEVQAKENETANKIVLHIKSAMQKLLVPEISANGREQKYAFQDSIRKALLLLQNDRHHGIPEDIEKRLNSLCRKWFTEVKMMPFYYQMALYVASKGNPKLFEELQNKSLSGKLKAILDGISKADQCYRAPIAHIEAAKTAVITSNLDLLRHTNMPNQFAKMIYKNAEGKTYESIHFRTGVPVGPRSGKIENGNKPWEINGISLVPEYLALLNDLKARKEKLLVVLHLDPKFYNTTTGEINNEKFQDYIKINKQREALWIKLMVDLSRHPDFKDILQVALIPLDGDWFKNDIEHYPKDMTLDSLILHLIQTIKKENSPFILPNMTPQEKEEFARTVAKQAADQYFQKFKDGTKFPLNNQQRLAFVGIFDSQLTEALQFKWGAKYVQHNCKDGIDRTKAIVGSELCEKNARLDRLKDTKVQDNIIGSTVGPALATQKRELLDERQPVLLSTSQYLEDLEEMGAVPIYNGYKLVDVCMGEDKDQSLYPAPSKANTREDYLRLLKFEEEHPFTVAQEIPTSSYKLGKNADQAAISQFMTDHLSYLFQRYSNEALKFKINETVEKPDVISSPVEGRPQHLKVDRQVGISDTTTGKNVALLNVQLVINLEDLSDLPKYNFKVQTLTY